MMDIAAAFDLSLKVAEEQDAVQTIRDVSALFGAFNAAKSGKLGMSNLTKAAAIAYLQEAIRTASLALQLIQDKDDGDANFAEIKALAGSLS